MEIWNAFLKALELIITFDRETMQIAARSLQFALSSCAIASLITIPLGSLIYFNNFWGKRFLVSMIQTLYSVPTVAVGLFVFVLISNAGPFGFLGILWTPAAIIFGQVVLIMPVMTGLVITALRGVDTTIIDTARSLGANRSQSAWLIVREARFGVVAAVVMGFGRAISEIGVSMMIGGNFRGFTRTITTAIQLETSMGNLELAMALGMILVFLALLVNIVMLRIQQK